MSFWDTLGKVGSAFMGVAGAGSPAGAFNVARSIASSEDDDPALNLDTLSKAGTQNLKDAGSTAATVADHTINSSVGQAAMAPFVLAADVASRGLATAPLAFEMGVANGDGELGALHSADAWRQAWNYSDNRNVGDVLGYGLFYKGGDRWADVIRKERAGAKSTDFDDYLGQGGRLMSGAIDIGATWFADPTMHVGQVTRLARRGNRIEDAAKAEDVWRSGRTFDPKTETWVRDPSVKNKPNIVSSAFGKGADTTNQRLGRTIASIDHVDSAAEVATRLGPTLQRSADAAPLVDLLAQAGKIKDLTLQRQMKANVMLAAVGSQGARKELAETAPALARAMQRATTAPEEMARLDEVFLTTAGHLERRGIALTEAAQRMSTPENVEELTAYGSTLDRIHTRFAQLDDLARTGGTEVVGRTALDRAKTWARSQGASFVYQDGASASTVHALHWATGQRARGNIATDDALQGQAQLADTLKRSGLYRGDEIRGKVDEYLTNTSQAGRARVLEGLHGEMLDKLAAKRGMTRERFDQLTSSLQNAFNAGRTYSTKELEAARAAGQDRVVLKDPVSGGKISLKTEVLETHIRNGVSVPDVKMYEKALDEHNRTRTPFESTRRGVQALNGGVNAVNDMWRLGMLARPGLIVRTQLDTQPRVAAMLGAHAYVDQAMRGLGHGFTKNVLRKDELHTLAATTEDLVNRDTAIERAAELRRQADLMDGVQFQNRPMEEIAASRLEDVTGRITSVQNRIKELEGTVQATSKRFDQRAKRADEKVQGIDYDEQTRLLEQISSYETALEGFGYKRRKGIMQRIRSAQDALTEMRAAAERGHVEITDLHSKLQYATSTKAKDALQKRIDKAQKEQDRLHGILNNLEDEGDNWLTRAGEETPERETKASRLRGRAAQIESEAKKLPERLGANRLGTTDRKVKLKGGTLTTRAMSDVQDEQNTSSALLAGDSVADVLLNTQSHLTRTFYENADDWKTHQPDSPFWNEAYIRATDAIRNSHTAKRILKDGDHPTADLIASLRKDPKVHAEHHEVMQGNDDFDEWLGRVVHYVDSHAPTPELRARLADGKRLTAPELDEYFRPTLLNDDEVITTARNLGLSEKEIRAAGRLSRDDLAGGFKKYQNEAERRMAKGAPVGDAKYTTARSRESLYGNLEMRRVDADRLDTKADRFDVHGPAMSILAPDRNAAGVKDALGKFVGKLSDKPDMVLGRHPLYVGRYFHHFRELAQRELDRAGEVSYQAQADIERIAKHRAIKDVHQTLFDTSRHTGAHETFRNVVPFMGAWEDAMSSWGRLMYDDPGRLSALSKVWNMPERMNIVVDQDGNHVPVNGAAEQKFITVSVPGLLQKYAGAKEFKFRKESLNSVFQGEVPWVPGFGPKVQIPASEVIARAYPELPNTVAGRNPLVRSMFPNGTPKHEGVLADLGNSMAPGWSKRVYEAFNPNSSGGINVYSQSIYSQVLDARKAGKPDPSAAELDKNAVKAVRSVGIIKALSLGLFGISGEGGNTADLYRAQYNALRAQEPELAKRNPPTTLEEEFIRLHPEAANLDFRLSRNNTGINATVKTQNRSRDFKKEIGLNPEHGWFYLGSDNLGGAFSQSVYNAQRSENVSGTSTVKKRDRYDAQESLAHMEASAGWAEYQKIDTQLTEIMRSRGLRNLQQKGAEDLASIKRDFVADLSKRNQYWAADRGSYDPTKFQQFLDNVAAPAMSNPKLKDRSDIVTMRQYLELRNQALQAVEEDFGLTSLRSDKASVMRDTLYEIGSELASQNLGFQQMWQRQLQREVEPDDATSKENQ